ncbi:MAG: glycosyltransferase [Candidatus Saccharimonadales bacterium]
MKLVLIYLILLANFVSMVHLGLYIIGGNIYDIRQFMRRRFQIKSQKSSRRPLVSVIVPAHNESAGIRKTLNSIMQSTYKNIEIIVVDDGSRDDTAAIVDTYWRFRPNARVQEYIARTPRSGSMSRRYLRQFAVSVQGRTVRQSNQGKGTAMNNAIKNYAQGEYVMCLDADSELEPHAIERAVRHLEDPNVMGVAANVRIGGGNHWLTLLQRFEHMIGYRAKKFYTVSNSEFLVGGVASTYRRELVQEVGYYDTDTMTEDIGLSLKLIAHKGNAKQRVIYAADVIAITAGVQTFAALMKQRYRWKLGSLQNLYKYRYLLFNRDSKKYSMTLTMYRLPMAFLSEIMLLLGPIMMAYLLYISISRHSFAIFAGAYMTLTLYTLWVIWPDEHYGLREKIVMSLQSLFIYGLFFTMDFVQLVAMIRVLSHREQVTLKTRTSSTWASPARAGQTEVGVVDYVRALTLKSHFLLGRAPSKTKGTNNINTTSPSRPYDVTVVPHVSHYKNQVSERKTRQLSRTPHILAGSHRHYQWPAVVRG